MKSKQFSVSALIKAPPQDLYSIIADYHKGHPEILPRPPFVSLDVEKGGIGEGTVIRVKMKVFGRTQSFRAIITEPDPGRVLAETNENGYVTTFTVEPRAKDKHAAVTIVTELPGRPALPGFLEYRFMKWLLQPVYVRELKQLEEAALKKGLRKVAAN